LNTEGGAPGDSYQSPMSRVIALGVGNTVLPNSSAPENQVLIYFCACIDLDERMENLELL